MNDIELNMHFILIFRLFVSTFERCDVHSTGIDFKNINVMELGLLSKC